MAAKSGDNSRQSKWVQSRLCPELQRQRNPPFSVRLHELCGSSELMSKPVPSDGLIGASPLAIVVVSLGTILTAIDGNIVNIALPTIMREFDERGCRYSLSMPIRSGCWFACCPYPRSAQSLAIARFLGRHGRVVAASVACPLAFARRDHGRTRGADRGAGIVSVMHAIVRAIYHAVARPRAWINSTSPQRRRLPIPRLLRRFWRPRHGRGCSGSICPGLPRSSSGHSCFLPTS